MQNVLRVDCQRDKKWGRELNTNLFSQTFRAISGYSGKILPKKFDFPGFEGHTELFGPHPFTWKTPTPPEDIRTKKFGFGFLFLRAENVPQIIFGQNPRGLLG